jgi:hypothetical protein
VNLERGVIDLTPFSGQKNTRHFLHVNFTAHSFLPVPLPRFSFALILPHHRFGRVPLSLASPSGPATLEAGAENFSTLHPSLPFNLLPGSKVSRVVGAPLLRSRKFTDFLGE